MNTRSNIRPIVLLILLALFFIVIVGTVVGTAGLDIPWWTADSGGGTSSGGAFEIKGTIGQVDAGAMSEGAFSLNGGFWGRASAVQAIALSSGWNLISGYVDPNPAALSEIFPDAFDDTLLCKDGDGNVYWPFLLVDQIGDWQAENGYRCFTATGFPFALSGTLIAPGSQLALAEGWNLIAYWRNIPIAAPAALSSCSGDILLAKNGAGEVYWPDYSINQIGDMQPGDGYQVYMINGCNLIYPDS